MSTSYCPNCGTEIGTGLKCPDCGNIDEQCVCGTDFIDGNWTCPSCDRVREHCPECGTHVEDDTCPSCGETKPPEILAQDYGLTDMYSPIQWLAAGIFALLSLPVGLIVPGYLYYKCKKGGAIEQSAFETGTVFWLGVIGIIGVDLGGRKGVMFSWGFISSIAVEIVILI